MSLPTNEMACSSKFLGVCLMADFWESMICFAFAGVRKFGVRECEFVELNFSEFE